MKRQIDEANGTAHPNTSSRMSALNLVDTIHEENQMSFLKQGDRSGTNDFVRETMDFNPTEFK